MKNILFSAILALGLFSLTGCYETTDSTVKTTKSKCGTGKCGEGKIADSTKKCGDGKCGEGKAKKAETATKCGAGKCGGDK